MYKRQEHKQINEHLENHDKAIETLNVEKMANADFDEINDNLFQLQKDHKHLSKHVTKQDKENEEHYEKGQRQISHLEKEKSLINKKILDIGKSIITNEKLMTTIESQIQEEIGKILKRQGNHGENMTRIELMVKDNEEARMVKQGTTVNNLQVY